MKKKQWYAAAGFLLLLLAVFLIWQFTRPAPVAGAKTVTLDVVHGDGSVATFPLHTDAETLRAALDEAEGLIAGEDGAYGLMVTAVDGETTDWSRDQSWWCLTKDGVQLDTGVDSTLIADGEHYEFTYTVG